MIKNKTFHLPSRKKLLEDTSIEIIVVDATEVEIVADEKKKDILSIAFSGGNKHDFRLFKESRPIIPEITFIIADKGYQGINANNLSIATLYAKEIR